MGYKSRSNYHMGLCMKFDCKNRNKKCKECINFSLYETNNNKKIKRNHKYDI